MKVGTITATDVATAKSYDDGYFSDTPSVPGNIFLAVNLTYTALADGFSYNPFDWQVFVDGVAVSGTAFVLNGPEPDLGSGSLPKGRKAAGWIVYEVAPRGKCSFRSAAPSASTTRRRSSRSSFASGRMAPFGRFGPTVTEGIGSGRPPASYTRL